MTKQEIIAAISAKIEGQGTNVDAGGGLAPILKAICDLIPEPAPAQEQSDWDEADAESPAYIKNKPTIPSAQEQADWDEADTESPAYIKNKPTISQGPLVVNGTYSSNTILVPSLEVKEQISNAFKSGRMVLINCTGDFNGRGLVIYVSNSGDDINVVINNAIRNVSVD